MSVRKTIYAGSKFEIGNEVATVKARRGLNIELVFSDGRIETWKYSKLKKYGKML
jgi:hypothetical protein